MTLCDTGVVCVTTKAIASSSFYVMYEPYNASLQCVGIPNKYICQGVFIHYQALPRMLLLLKSKSSLCGLGNDFGKPVVGLILDLSLSLL